MGGQKKRGAGGGPEAGKKPKHSADGNRPSKGTKGMRDAATVGGRAPLCARPLLCDRTCAAWLCLGLPTDPCCAPPLPRRCAASPCTRRGPCATARGASCTRSVFVRNRAPAQLGEGVGRPWGSLNGRMAADASCTHSGTTRPQPVAPPSCPLFAPCHPPEPTAPPHLMPVRRRCKARSCPPRASSPTGAGLATRA